jgi:hypothetical protein
VAKPAEEKLNACDVLNWDYLVEIAVKAEQPAKSLFEALTGFAYDFTSTADEGVRNQMLLDFLHNATDNTSRESATEVIKCLAKQLRSDEKLLKKFAKQSGIRLTLFG